MVVGLSLGCDGCIVGGEETGGSDVDGLTD